MSEQLPFLPAGVGPSEGHIRVFEAYRREFDVPDSEMPLSTAAVNEALEWWNVGAPDFGSDGDKDA